MASCCLTTATGAGVDRGARRHGGPRRHLLAAVARTGAAASANTVASTLRSPVIDLLATVKSSALATTPVGSTLNGSGGGTAEERELQCAAIARKTTRRRTGNTQRRITPGDRHSSPQFGRGGNSIFILGPTPHLPFNPKDTFDGRLAPRDHGGMSTRGASRDRHPTLVCGCCRR